MINKIRTIGTKKQREHNLATIDQYIDIRRWMMLMNYFRYVYPQSNMSDVWLIIN